MIRSRVQRLDFIQGGDQLSALLRIGLAEIQVDAVVSCVTRYDQANRRNMQARRVAGISMSERHNDQIMPL